MTKLVRAFLLAVIISGAFIGSGAPSSAKGLSDCNGPMGGIRGFRDLFGTYCEAVYMASVAREFGMEVSAKQVYENKLLKVEICQFAGHDIRLQNLCLSYVPH